MTDEPLYGLENRLEEIDRRIDALRRHLPGERRPPQPAVEARAMNCPHCGSPLEPGKIRLHGDLGTLLMFGFGLEHGWFQPDASGEEERVLHTTKPRRAYRCGRCRTVVILG